MRQLFSSLFFSCALYCTSTAQDTLTIDTPSPVDVPAEAKSFIITGYEALDYITGDLNNDKKADAILILRQPGEDTVMEMETTRLLLLLIRQPDGKLKEQVRNVDAIMCRQCGGVFGDPYAGTSIFPGGFTISFCGGSSWRWTYDYQFRYRPAQKTWFLSKQTETSFQSGDPEATMKKIVIGPTEIIEASIEKFNGDTGYEDSRWTVIAAKTFFYDSPSLTATPRKGFLLKGNVATGIRQTKNFVEVSFDNGKGSITDGFIRKKDLQKIK